jgi:hypothetical protein
MELRSTLDSYFVAGGVPGLGPLSGDVYPTTPPPHHGGQPTNPNPRRHAENLLPPCPQVVGSGFVYAAVVTAWSATKSLREWTGN